MPGIIMPETDLPMTPLPAAAPPYLSEFAGDASARVQTVTAASANEQRRLANVVRDEARKVCAEIEAEQTKLAAMFAKEKKGVQDEAERKATELEALADRIDSSGEAVAQGVEDYTSMLAAVGMHTEDLCNRLRPPVPHRNGRGE